MTRSAKYNRGEGVSIYLTALRLIAETEQGLADVMAIRDRVRLELDECKYRKEEMQAQYDEVISWTEPYDAADLSAKKMIVANLINYIEVFADYELHIDMNIDLELFGIHLDFCTFGEEKAA